VADNPFKTIGLTAGETAILASLMTHTDQVLSCSELAGAAVGRSMSEAEAQSVVRLYIFRLRRKIATLVKKPGLIRTIRNRGYHFVPPMEVIQIG